MTSSDSIPVNERELDCRIAKALGLELWGDEFFAPSNPMYRVRLKGRSEARPVPRYTSRVNDFATVEEEIKRRGLGQDYANAILVALFGDERAVRSAAEDFEFLTASLSVKCRAALTVLEGE